MDNFFGFIGAYYLIPSFIIGMIGFLLGWFLKPSTRQAGDLSIQGEGALRAEADSLRARVQDLENRLTSRDSEVSDLKSSLAASSVAPATSETSVTEKTTDSDETYALEWQNRYLAARVKYLDSRLATMGEEAKAVPATKTSKKAAKATAAVSTGSKTKAVAKPKAKAVTTTKAKAASKPASKSKTAAKPKAAAKTTATAATKKASTKKAPAKKASTKKATAKPAASKPVATKKTAAKKPAKNPNQKYYDNVQKFDARASKTVVDNIVKHCGVSLKSRDSSLVACSDETELQTVAKGFVTKKLGMNEGQMDLVKSVCDEMKAQRMKNRVTFYYLAAKKAKKLDLFR